MTLPMTATGAAPRHLVRSTCGVLLGFAAVVVLSLGLVLSVAGAVALALTAVPTAWLGGILHRTSHSER
jgi:hypothetical protein